MLIGSGETSANIYLFKIAIKTPERCQWRRSGVFIINFEHILHLFLMFPLLLWAGKYMLGIARESINSV